MATADSDQGSVASGVSTRSGSSQSTTGTTGNDLQVGTFCSLTSDRCGAVFHVSKRPEEEYVCFSIGTCKRHGHKKATTRGDVDHWFEVVKSTRVNYDGLLSSSLSDEAYQKVLAKRKEDGRAAVAGHNTPLSTSKRAFMSPEPIHTPDRNNTSVVSFAGTGIPGKGDRKSSPSSSSPSTSTPTSTVGSNSSPQAVEVADLKELMKTMAANMTAMQTQHQAALESARKQKAKDKKKKKKSSSKKSRRNNGSSRRRLRGDPDDSPSNSDSSATPDPSSADESSVDGATPVIPAPRQKAYWYVVVGGSGGSPGVYPDEATALSHMGKGSSQRRFEDEDKAWEFFMLFMSKSENSPTSVTGISSSVQSPTIPPHLLTGKDPSTGELNEVFNLNLKVSGKALRESLGPPGLDSETARDLGEAMLDAVSLPGKITETSEAEEVGTNIQASLQAFADMAREQDYDEVLPKDTKWKSNSRTVLRSVKDAEGLKQHLKDVKVVKETCIQDLITTQETILQNQGWNEQAVESWSYGGYISTISRRSLDLYLDLLVHLVDTHVELGWTLAKREMDHYVHRLTLLRSGAANRLLATCRIYAFLRDCADKHWKTQKLESEKITELYKKLAVLQEGGDHGGTGACDQCGTTLHGGCPCPVSHLKRDAARKAGRKMLLALCEGGKAPKAAGDKTDD